jgi:voltage-gated potassium channel
VTESAGPRTDARREARRRFRRVVTTLLRALASTAGLVALYYLIPLDPASIGVTIGQLAVGLSALVGLVVWQVRSIVKATYPALRAVGALATSVPLFLLLFAGTYFVMGGISDANFSEPLTRTDALYFTVTVFATVGFGDIVATTQGARVVVMGQMISGIVIIGLGARVIVDAVRRGQKAQESGAADSERAPE